MQLSNLARVAPPASLISKVARAMARPAPKPMIQRAAVLPLSISVSLPETTMAAGGAERFGTQRFGTGVRPRELGQ